MALIRSFPGELEDSNILTPGQAAIWECTIVGSFVLQAMTIIDRYVYHGSALQIRHVGAHTSAALAELCFKGRSQ